MGLRLFKIQFFVERGGGVAPLNKKLDLYFLASPYMKWVARGNELAIFGI